MPCGVGTRVADVVPRTSRVSRRGPCTGQVISPESRIGDECRSALWQLAGLPGLESRSWWDVPCRRVLHG